MKMSDRNSRQATEYANKRKEQLERANKLRREREAQEVAKQLSSLDINASVGPAAGCTALSSHSSMGGVTVSSYTDSRTGASVAERIVVGRDAMTFRDPWAAMPGAEVPPVRDPPRARHLVPSHRAGRQCGGETKQEVVSRVDVSGDFETVAPANNHYLSADSEKFFASPLDPAGTLFDVSEMPVLCMSTRGGEVIVGCADHALYSVSLTPPTSGSRSGVCAQPITTMYGKKHGHSDWVTSVCHIADGRVLSGGMDNRLCLWNASRSSCVELPNGHERSVSKVLADTTYNVALSCGYDGNVMVWSFGASGESSGAARRGPARSTAGVVGPKTVLTGHKSPVVECVFKGPTVACGTKEGSLFFWDLPTGSILNRQRAHKNGPVTALEQIENSPLFVSGGSDGVLKIWDPRSPEGSKGSVARVDVHASSAKSTTGVVTAITSLEGNGGGDISYVVTGGSDGNIVATDCRVLEPSSSDRLIPVHRWQHHRAPVNSVTLAGNGGCVFASDAAGMILCYDVLGLDRGYVIGKGSSNSFSDTGAGIGLRYGLGGSSRGGVRTLACNGECVVAGGDDGNVLVYKF